MIRSVFWFHPAMWWLVSRVQLARETVVDELSILVTNARRTYLDTLLAFADDTGLASSPAFSARRHLFHRVMLLSKEGEMSSIRVAVGSCRAGRWRWAPERGARSARSRCTADAPRRTQGAAARSADAAALPSRRRVEYSGKRRSADTSLTPEQKLDTILKGIAAEDRALAINPDYVEALVYKNILLRMQANLTRRCPGARRRCCARPTSCATRRSKLRRIQRAATAAGRGAQDAGGRRRRRRCRRRRRRHRRRRGSRDVRDLPADARSSSSRCGSAATSRRR